MRIFLGLLLLLQFGHSTEVGQPYMQFHTYAQIKYPDGRYCVYSPFEKIPILETVPVECVRASKKYKDGVIPSNCY